MGVGKQAWWLRASTRCQRKKNYNNNNDKGIEEGTKEKTDMKNKD